MSSTRFLLFAALVCACATPRLVAAPLLPYSPDTGSYYQFVGTKLTWTAARADAETRSYLGRPGRLATVTSAVENGFIVNNVIPNVNNGDSYWLGGYQLPSSPEPAGGWVWISGEPWSYTNWRAGEPSNNLLGGGYENRLELFNLIQSGTWNDLFDGNVSLSEGYVVEYVPEPSFGLMIVAAAAILRRPLRRRPA